MKKKLLYAAVIAVLAIGILFNGIEEGVGSEVKTGLVIVAILGFCAYMKHVTKQEEAEKMAAQAELKNMQIVKDDVETAETPAVEEPKEETNKEA